MIEEIETEDIMDRQSKQAEHDQKQDQRELRALTAESEDRQQDSVLFKVL